jgi:hypothetical protein
MTIWTHGRWTVKDGREDEFVRTLAGLAQEAAAVGAQPLDAGGVRLLRDRDRPNVFLTFGSWGSIDEVERFRAFLSPRLTRFDDVIEGVDVFTLDEVRVD